MRNYSYHSVSSITDAFETSVNFHFKDVGHLYFGKQGYSSKLVWEIVSDDLEIRVC